MSTQVYGDNHVTRPQARTILRRHYRQANKVRPGSDTDKWYGDILDRYLDDLFGEQERVTVAAILAHAFTLSYTARD